MHRFVFPLAALLLLATSGVRAGHQQWEGSVQLQAPHPVEHIELNTAGYAVTDNATHNALMKRWFTIRPVKGPGETQRWPDKTISYCYETPQARKALYKYLREARRKWQSAGLNSLVYKYQQVAPPGDDCVKNPQRSRILVISYNTDGKLSTIVGMRSRNGDDDTYKGPYMKLSTSTEVGMLDVAANIAHELGHAWGLAHEHQNPYFWGSNMFADPENPGMPEGLNSRDDPPFHRKNFKCTALKDYQTVHTYVSAQHPNDLERLCTTYQVALKHGFSASDWLPISGHGYRYGTNDPFATKEGVDWKSIMLYPSGAGGNGQAAPANPGQEQNANDNRDNILVDQDGNRFSGNFDPSPKDIEGIHTLYEDSNFPDGEPVLISDEGSKFGSKFRSAFGKAKCHIIPDDSDEDSDGESK